MTPTDMFIKTLQKMSHLLSLQALRVISIKILLEKICANVDKGKSEILRIKDLITQDKLYVHFYLNSPTASMGTVWGQQMKI